ncbi:MAG: hypothetical protein ACE5I7_18220 [Candidatus Binatia bacterium]
MSYRTWTLAFATVASAAGVVGIVVQSRAPVAGGPIAQITAPLDGFKLRQGRTATVRVHVAPGTQPLRDWGLRLLAPDGSADELARGGEGLTNGAVAELSAHALEAGVRYTLELRAHDTAGAEAAARVSFLIPDPQYTLVPLEPGNFSVGVEATLSIDAFGDLVAFGGPRTGASADAEIVLFYPKVPALRSVRVTIASSEGQQLSKDGRRFFFRGGPPQPSGIGIGFLDLRTDQFTPVAPGGEQLFTVDHGGQRLAFLALDPDSNTEQYYLYDEATQEVRQLTTDPQAFRLNRVCPQPIGATPMLSGDGDTVALITSATLGLAPADPPGCHIFAYDVPSASLRHVRTLPTSARIDLPAISDDGRWLSFTVARITPPQISRDFPALLDLQTGGLTEPLGGITDYTNFDAVISGDASAVVISSQADLDPRVGNADHNLDLFVYDRASGAFTQVTETVGGIGRFPGGCPPYRPQVSRAARVVAFQFLENSGQLCQLDAPQRNEADGLNPGRVRAVRKRRGNRAPAFAQPPNLRVEASQTLNAQFSATDPESDPIVFFAQELGRAGVPQGSEITDHHDGRATLRWQTTPDNIGFHTLRVAVFDEGGGEVFHDVRVAVCARIFRDGNLPGVAGALFTSEPPPACHEADVNADGEISAADVVKAAFDNQSGLPGNPAGAAR